MASTDETGPRDEKLGYLGLGLMGIPMTRRLLNAGHDVTVWNRSPGKAAGLVEAGAALAATPRDVASERRHYLHVPPRCSRRGASGVRSRRPGKRRRRRQTRGRLLLDPSRCGAFDRGAAEGRERHGLDRRAGLRRHQGRRGRHARGDGRRRCRRYRAGAALCAGDGAPVHAYGPDRRGPDHKALQPDHLRLQHGGASRRRRGSPAMPASTPQNCRKRWPAALPIQFPCNCSCRGWRRAFTRRRSAISRAS